ncbi:ranaspumin-like isoform 2-T2 [Leptodactylus fuscus]|uniref:ranaspumin-like isoform X2 n=1 Tax=Leptodactylus fuscus TaxID=238119 RepID=UPI003F4EA7E4
MKIAVVFFLLAVIGCSEGLNSVSGGGLDLLLCLEKLLEAGGNITLAAGQAVCGDRDKHQVRGEALDYIRTQIQEATNDGTCTAGIVPGIITTEINLELLTNALDTVYKKGLLEVVCSVVGPALDKDCTPEMLRGQLAKFVKGLDEFCKGEKKHLSIEEIEQIVKMAPCVIDEATILNIVLELEANNAAGGDKKASVTRDSPLGKLIESLCPLVSNLRPLTNL